MAEITREPNFWNPASGQSDNVVVTSATATTIKKGTILLSDGAGKYSPVATPISATTVTERIAIALETVALAKGGTATIKAVKAGVIGIEPLYEAAGYTETTAPDYVLDTIGGKSNLVFVHVKEVN